MDKIYDNSKSSFLATMQTKCLDDLIKHSESIYSKFRSDFMFEELGTMRSLREELELLQNTLALSNKKVSAIVEQSNTLFTEHVNKFRNTLKIMGNVNAPSSVNDTFEPILSDKFMMQLVTPDQRYENVAPGVQIPVIMVDTIKDLPNYNMFFIKDFAQFAIKINGQVLRGNIGHIDTNNKQCKRVKRNTTKCIYNSGCDYIDTNECSFYHDMLDYERYTPDVLEQRKKQNIHIRNYRNHNWLYTSEPQNSKNNYMKHIGSEDRLSTDIPLVSESEIDLLKDMLLHDLLVSLSIYHNR